MPAVSALPARTRPSGAGSTESSRPSAGLAILLALLGLGAMATALLGPLALGWIDYHVSSGAADQLRGGDVAGLVLVGPVALAAAWRVATGRPGADALALAPASYGLYMYTELAITGDLACYDGNSERWFPLLWALVTISGAVLALAGARLVRTSAPSPRPRLERVTGWYLLVVALFLTIGLHLPGLVDAWREAPTSEEYLADPVAFWVVKLLDLAYVGFHPLGSGGDTQEFLAGMLRTGQAGSNTAADHITVLA
jgi:hypothetical protein